MLCGSFPSALCMPVAHYVTNDPYLASFLVSEGAILAGCSRLGPKRVEFRFVADPTLHNLLRLYWSKERIFISPSRLLGTLQELKKRTFVRSPQSGSSSFLSLP